MKTENKQKNLDSLSTIIKRNVDHLIEVAQQRCDVDKVRLPDYLRKCSEDGDYPICQSSIKLLRKYYRRLSRPGIEGDQIYERLTGFVELYHIAEENGDIDWFVNDLTYCILVLQQGLEELLRSCDV